MAIFFRVTDNHNGTVTYQWENSSLIFESAFSVYRFPVNTGSTVNPRTIGPRITDVNSGTPAAGEATVAVANGFHIFQPHWWANAGGGYQTAIYWPETPPVFGRVDSLSGSVEWRCRQSVIDTIKLLNLDEIGSNVSEQLVEDVSGLETLPSVICTAEGVQETQDVIMSTTDDVGYPIRVMILDRVDPKDHARLRVYEMWRERIAKAFRHQQLMGVVESKICTIEPYVIVEPTQKHYQFFASGLVIRCMTRHTRGLS